MIAAGINDWGGVSPVTPDHVNPEAPWPHLDDLARRTAEAGKLLVERLAIYPAFVSEPSRTLARALEAGGRNAAACSPTRPSSRWRRRASPMALLVG